MPDLPPRIQLSRQKGWRMPPGAVKVDRSTMWGNPFVADGDPAWAVGLFESWLRDGAGLDADPTLSAQRAAILKRLPELRGRPLACWCKPGTPCHADVLLELANRPEE